MAGKAKPKDLNLQQAKIAVRESIGKIAKDAVQSYRDYKYVSHEAVTAAVMPAMHQVGMTHTPSCESIEVHDGVAFVRIKVQFQMANEWFEEGEGEASYSYSADKIKDGTSMGAIISYGIKTALLKYFGLESGDPDLEEFQAKTDSKKPKAKKAKAKEAPAKGLSEFDAEVAETLDIFNGTTMPTREDLERFVELCNEYGVTSEQLDDRLTTAGYANLDHVPQEIMVEWIANMETANA